MNLKNLKKQIKMTLAKVLLKLTAANHYLIHVFLSLKHVNVLQLYGHRNVSVLDGGYNKWVADGFPTTTEEPEVEVCGNRNVCIDQNPRFTRQ